MVAISCTTSDHRLLSVFYSSIQADAVSFLCDFSCRSRLESSVAHRAPVVFLKYQQGQAVPNEQAEEANYKLEERHLPGQAIFAQGSAPDEPQIEDGEVARLDEAALFVGCDLEKAELSEDVQDLANEGVGLALGGPGGD